MIVIPASQSGFQTFVTTVMGIPTTALAVNDPVIAMAYNIAVDIVNSDLLAIPDLYALAVYNLAASNVINYAQDIPNGPTNNEGLLYFAALRKQWGLNSFSPGLVQSTSDGGTSSSMALPNWTSGLTLSDLQLLNDPYGRRYLAIAQKVGPSLWGMS